MGNQATCSKGHLWSENTVLRADGSRRCRACTRVYDRAYQKGTKAYATWKGPEYRANRAVVLAEAPPYCAICGAWVDKGLSGRDPAGPSVDHIIPVSAGGTHELSNLALVHALCNSRKQNKVAKQTGSSTSTRRW